MPLESDNKSQAVLPSFLPPLVLEQIFNFMNPVGSFYYNKVDPRSPTEIFGIGCGTWVAESGYFPIGKASSGTFNTLGATGGTESVTLTAAQSGLPAHTHNIKYSGSFTGGYSSLSRNNAFEAYGAMSQANTAENASQSHTNLPPYRVISMWVRIA